ncbi:MULTISPECIES: hypothetical protein [unclassified Clostridium]|uniref:hypothetical protein n=1 Tax=unclassified Clostridium TaxID=2614128 RepID=UPI0032176363
MKKFIKPSILCIVMLLSLSSIFLGCSKKTIPIEQTAKAFYDLVILQDSAEFEKLGVTNDEITSMAEIQKKSMNEVTKAGFVQAGLPITDEQLDQIYNVQIEALRKLKPTIEVVSSDKEISQVKISTTYVNMVEASTKAGDDTISEVQSKQISDMTKVSEIFIKKIIENINALTPSTDVKSTTFEFEKVKMNFGKKTEEVWVPKDSISFGNDLANMCIGNN